MGRKNSKQHNKSKNRNGTDAKKRVKRDMEVGLKEDIRVVHGEENNPHDG